MHKLQSIFNNLTSKQVFIIYVVTCLFLYGNTLNHHYALDDAIVLTKNEFTKQGINGIPNILKYDSFTGFFGIEKKLVEGGRYRPLSLITFAIEYSIWGENPLASHLINILLYAFIAIFTYKLVQLLFLKTQGQKQAQNLALLSSFIFLVHPVHTEAVANIKGRDELMTLLFSLSAFYTSVKFIDSKKLVFLFTSAILLFLGLMSKENAITFVAIIPLALIYFTNSKTKTVIIATIPLIISSILFLYIRYQVLGGFHNSGTNELMNNPFTDAHISQKYATIIYTWIIYIKLLVFPHPLTYDYYPYHIPLVDFSNIWVLLSIITHLLLVVIAIKGIKKKHALSFSIIAYFASFSIVSNLLFSVGTFMNERFIFTPSVFWCLGLATLIYKLPTLKSKLTKSVAITILLLTISFYGVKTVTRNNAWKNDLTLFTTDVKTSHNSAKSNCSAGGKLWEEAKKNSNTKKQNEYYALSEKYLNKAIQIHPNYVDAWLLLGNLLYDYKKDIDNSVRCFIEVLERQPRNENAWSNADIVLQNSNDRNTQLKHYEKLNKIDSNKYTINYRIGVLHGRFFNNLDKGIHYLEKAHKINSRKLDAIKDLGTAYGIKGNEALAYEYSLKALQLDKNDYQIYINLGIAASKLGKHDEAKEYFKQGELLKQKQ